MEKVVYEFYFSIFEKLKSEVAGKVRYKAYSDMDLVIFIITFKGYVFEYPLKDVSGLMNVKSSDDIVKDIKERYRDSILKTFFKKKK